ncbi:MAG: TonB-dependent receptor [Sporocytophaga sp.]|nr:TonB-dependent receptor [Sporocytophaga sp.]
MKLLSCFNFFLFVSIIHCKVIAQDTNYTISGYVRDSGTRAGLPGVMILISPRAEGTTTNAMGYYNLSVPPSDSAEITFSFVGYNTVKKVIAVKGDVQLDITLGEEAAEIKEVVVEGQRYKSVSDGADMSNIEIPIDQIKDVPTLMGEKDVLKTIQLMPGVQKGSEGTAGLYVRGGGPGENLFLLDNATVYNPYHLFGFFSSFNGDALKSVELIKGGFPARYGGRLSSVIDMEIRNGNNEKIHAEGGIGLIASRLTVEGPIKKGKSSFIVSGRRTYLDALMYPFLSSDTKGGYYFYDFNWKFNFDINPKNRIYLSGYFGRDKFFARFKDSYSDTRAWLRWGNTASTLAWDHIYNEKISSRTSLIYSNYIFDINNEEKDQNEVYKLRYISNVKDISLKHEYHIAASSSHSLKIGLISTLHTFKPEAVVYQEENFDNVNFDNKIRAVETSVYIQDIFKPVPRLTINAGIRLSSYITKDKKYLYPEPRITAGYKIRDDIAVKGGFAIMNQYVHQATSGGLGLPLDLWVPTAENIRPAQSRQLSLGLAKDFPGKNLVASLEGFYKRTNRSVGFKEGASFFLSEDMVEKTENSWKKNLTQGQGWSYGLEFLLHKRAGKFSGWIGYTLSWTQLQFDSVNFGKKFYARYDRRHDISLVGIYKLSDKVHLSATWVYGTGNAITIPNATFGGVMHNPGSSDIYSGRDLTDYGGKNEFRMKPYHRLDVGIKFIKKFPSGRERTWDLSIYNAYSRKNPYFYYMTAEGGKNVIKQVSLFPIIPSITYNFKF